MKNKKTYRYDLDKPSERFFGWLPKKPASIVVTILLVIYYLFAIFGWRKLPQVLVMGWWPMPLFSYCFMFVPVLIVILCVYYYKFWPELKEPEDEEEQK